MRMCGFVVQAVIKKYRRAIDNLAEARSAFNRLNDATPPLYTECWEVSITEAESARSSDPSSMDVMQSQIKTGQSLKEITADILREEGRSQRVVTESGSSTDWILAGLRIEEEQSVHLATSHHS